MVLLAGSAGCGLARAAAGAGGSRGNKSATETSADAKSLVGVAVKTAAGVALMVPLEEWVLPSIRRSTNSGSAVCNLKNRLTTWLQRFDDASPS